ncbi:hypothetical protein EN825_35335, partial [Mesorhizobium sp. M8A.F.Ca.ET.182.01.1.1]
KKTKEAAKLISSDQEPLINLLDAQASLLEGDHEGAREKFGGHRGAGRTRVADCIGHPGRVVRLGGFGHCCP